MLIVCQAFEQFFFIFFLLNALKGETKRGAMKFLIRKQKLFLTTKDCLSIL